MNAPGRATGVMFVRPEYGALAEEFGVLAADFGHRVDASLRRDIARLAAAIECIDRHVDAVDDVVARTATWRGVVDVLEAGDVLPATVELPAELVRSTRDLRALGQARGVLPRIVRIVKKEALTSEAMRSTRDARAFVRCVLREGRLTAALALLVAGRACGARFRRFFFRLGGPANLVDKIKDVRDDHARGEMALRPSISLHLRLVLTLCVRMPALLASHPRWPTAWIGVARLGVRYLGRSA